MKTVTYMMVVFFVLALLTAPFAMAQDDDPNENCKETEREKITCEVDDNGNETCKGKIEVETVCEPEPSPSPTPQPEN